ncbi:MAG: hypothetical protein ABI091_24585, partial [Ferruginibacter sp.]
SGFKKIPLKNCDNGPRKAIPCTGFLVPRGVSIGFVIILSSIACVSKTTIDVIKNAMESVKTKNVIEWYKNNIGKSVQAKRMSAFRLPEISEQKVYQELLAANG